MPSGVQPSPEPEERNDRKFGWNLGDYLAAEEPCDFHGNGKSVFFSPPSFVSATLHMTVELRGFSQEKAECHPVLFVTMILLQLLANIADQHHQIVNCLMASAA